MFKDIQKLGKDRLEGLTDLERKERVLQSYSYYAETQDKFERKKEKENKYHEIIWNLNLDKGLLEIEIGKELEGTDQERRELMGLDLAGNGAKKTYLTHNNYYYVRDIISGMIYKIDEIRETEEIEILKDNLFLDYLLKIKDIFYENIGVLSKDKNKKGKEKIIAEGKIGKIKEEVLRRSFPEITKGRKLKTNANKQAILKKIVAEKLNSTQTFVKKLNIFTVKINGERIEKRHKFYKDYIDLAYHIRVDNRFFKGNKSHNNPATNQNCHSCNKNHSKTVNGIQLVMPFYTIDKENFFNQRNSNHAYKSFTLCQKCYEEYLVGINYIYNNLRGRLLKNDFTLVPREIYNTEKEKYEEKLITVVETLEKMDNYNPQDIERLNSVKRLLSKNNHTLKFDLLLHKKDQSSYKIFDVLYNVDFSIFVDMLYNLEDIVHKYSQNNTKKEKWYRVNLNTIIGMLTKGIMKKNDLEEKRLFLQACLGRKYINKHELNQYFLSGFKREFNDNRKSYYKIANNPLKYLITREFIDLQNNKKEVKKLSEKEKEFYDSLQEQDFSEEIKEQFELNPAYKNNLETQGMFLLGYLIGQVYNEQTKRGQGTTIINQIDFFEINKRNLSSFLSLVSDKLSRIRVQVEKEKVDLLTLKKKEYKAATSRLSQFKEFKLDKNELVLHLLVGFSYGQKTNFKKGEDK